MVAWAWVNEIQFEDTGNCGTVRSATTGSLSEEERKSWRTFASRPTELPGLTDSLPGADLHTPQLISRRPRFPE